MDIGAGSTLLPIYIGGLFTVLEVHARIRLAPRSASSDVSERSTPRKMSMVSGVFGYFLAPKLPDRPIEP